MACVAHAFWITCLAKNISSSLETDQVVSYQDINIYYTNRIEDRKIAVAYIRNYQTKSPVLDCLKNPMLSYI